MNENGFAVLGTMRMLREKSITVEQAEETVNMWLEIAFKRGYSHGITDEMRRVNKSSVYRSEKGYTSRANEI